MTYSTFFSQRAMTFDDHRNGLYADVIRKLVTPDSVVLDLGAGLGVHGLVAAMAGAKRVYLVEPETVVNVAMDIARANGLADRIVVLQGKIEEVELPEKVDLIVSVFTGNLLFSEDLLPSLFFARDRYLKPGGRMIPDEAELMVAPVSAAELHAKHVACWSRPNMGLDFSPGRRFAANEILWLRREEARLDKLAPGAAVASVELTTAIQADCDGEARYTFHASGLCHGLLCWIRIRLGDQWLSSDPDEPEVHWSPVLLPLDPPIQADAGQEVKVSVRRRTGGDWTWTVTSAAGAQRHSSFLARVDGAARLRKMSPDYRPVLGRRGQDVLQILEKMQAGWSNREIADHLAEVAHEACASTDEAMQRVQALALNYGKPD